MKRVGVLVFGVFSYLVFLGVFLYAIGFVGGFGVPKTMDGPIVYGVGEALLVNCLLILVFGLQHSIMARPWFKHWWTKLIPEPLERSTYVLMTNLALILLYWQWRPTAGVVWAIDHTVLQAVIWTLFAAGWLTVLITTFLINHFDLFGLRQPWLYFLGRPYEPLNFVTPGPYRWVRHPLYVGWLLAFWATPTMSTTHFLFALGLTAYILVAIQFEERDLVRYHGSAYQDYRKRVPMLIPRLGKSQQVKQHT